MGRAQALTYVAIGYAATAVRGADGLCRQMQRDALADRNFRAVAERVGSILKLFPKEDMGGILLVPNHRPNWAADSEKLRATMPGKPDRSSRGRVALANFITWTSRPIPE